MARTTPGRMTLVARPAVCLLLFVPLLLLQTFEASQFFCAGSAHASFLSSLCAHHEDGSGTPAGDPGNDHHSAGDSDIDPCRCPGSDNPLPDSLTDALLGGVGIPSVTELDVSQAALGHLSAPTPLTARILLPSRTIDRPPISTA